MPAFPEQQLHLPLRHRLPRGEPERGQTAPRGGDQPSTYFTADVVAMFIEHYGSLAEGDRQLWRATAHGWHLYSVPLPRPADDYRTYEVEITELCVRRALTAEEHAEAEQRARAFIRPHVEAIRAALRNR
ncbi:hypothetical protein [Streptomyces sp. NPDC006335]|uniref:hypothetical protein n=1 Tax=Streptomyces sp. NPDC006335 TaxID=3156895 RepID=UPI0033A1267A